MAAQFQFIVRTGPNAGKTFMLDGTEITIGRDTSNNIPLNDAEVSRKHARLVWKTSGYVLEDLGSTNGTFVNGNRISGSIPLKSGDAVSFGENISLTYEAAMDVNATMVSSGKAAKTAAPVQQPAPAPAPAPAYSGQVPAGPAPAPAAPKKPRSRVALIVIIVIVLCLILGCVALLFWVDSSKNWCTFPFSYLAKILGGVCP
jgi:predicted component of type VI protein secretion system